METDALVTTEIEGSVAVVRLSRGVTNPIGHPKTNPAIAVKVGVRRQQIIQISIDHQVNKRRHGSKFIKRTWNGISRRDTIVAFQINS